MTGKFNNPKVPEVGILSNIDVLTAIMNGRQPAESSASGLLQECRRDLLLDRQQQRDALGFR